MTKNIYKKPAITISVSLPAELYDRLNALTVDIDVPRNRIIVSALRDFLGTVAEQYQDRTAKQTKGV